jgi:sugar transferase (PEP-CTERM/EpsH1 system associated)
MDILFLTPQLPYPPYQGTTLRNFGLVRGAAQAGHAVTLLSFREANQPAPADTPLQNLCAELVTVPAPPPRPRATRALDLLVTGQPDMARRLRSATFDRALQDLLNRKRFDAIQIEGIEMARFRPSIKAVQPRAPLIYDAHNAEHELQRRACVVARSRLRTLHAALYSRVQWVRLLYYERDLCRAVRHVLAVSQADAEALRALAGVPVTVIPNGLDVDTYAQPPAETVDLGKAALVFTGKMDYRPNVDAVLWFADEALPRIRAEVPDARFIVVGQKPHPNLARLRDAPGVTLTGLVPAVEPYLHAAAVYVAPLRMGSGTRFKVLQAMAAGVPVVSTSTGAEGIGITPGHDVAIADTAEGFAGAVVNLLNNADRRAAMVKAARGLVTRRYDWSNILPPLMKLYSELEPSPDEN